ncbi:MAG: MATE family efflux transporter [Acidobacteriota bacterium]
MSGSGSPDGAPRSSILRLSAPLVVSFWMRAAFSLVDTVYAATIGDHAVAAIGLTVPFEFLMIALWVGLSTGLTAHLSRAMGARAAERLEQYVAVTWRLVGILAPAFGLLGAAIWFLAPHMELEPRVAEAFRVYGSVLVIGSAATSFWSIVPDSLVKAHHDTRSTMWAGILSNVINVTLNTVFVFVFHWGVFGIALSTVIGRIGGLVYALHRAAVHERARRAAWTDVRPGRDPHPWRAILGLGVPSAVTFILMSGEVSVINWLLARTEHPTEAIAAFSIYYRVLLFASQPMIATAVAMLPFAGRLLGENDPRGVRRGLRQSGLAGLVYVLFVMAPLVVPFAPAIAGALSEGELTRRYAALALRAVPLATLASLPFFLARPVFEAMGRGRPGLLLATLRYVVLSVPLAWLGMRAAVSLGRPGFDGVIAGTIAASLLSSLVMALWIRRALRGWPRATD